MWARKWGALLRLLVTHFLIWRPNFARTALCTLCSLSPSCSSFLTLCHDSVLVLDSFCFRSLGLCWLSWLCCLLLFVRGLISHRFLQFHCFTLSMVYSLFVIHLIYILTYFIWCLLYAIGIMHQFGASRQMISFCVLTTRFVTPVFSHCPIQVGKNYCRMPVFLMIPSIKKVYM
jgi:hypothetical protein